MSIQVTEIEVTHTDEEDRTSYITLQRLGDSLHITDKHGNVSISEEMIGDLINALNIFKCGY